MHSYNTWKARAVLYFKGIGMGGADIIPGVSGGTIALISHIYDNLIEAIASVKVRHAADLLLLIFTFPNTDKRKFYLERLSEIHWNFILTLGAGILTGILSMSRVIPYFMEEYPFFMYSFFFGLIVLSAFIPFREMKKEFTEFVLVAFFAAAAWIFTGSSAVSDAAVTMQKTIAADGQTSSLTYTAGMSGEWKLDLNADEFPASYQAQVKTPSGESLGSFSITLSLTEKNGKPDVSAEISENLEKQGVFLRKSRFNPDPAGGPAAVTVILALSEDTAGGYLHLFFSGAVAICAMILPGISGAYVLVLTGHYKEVLEAIHNFDIATLGVLGAGILTGIMSFIKILQYLLKHYHSMTMAALTGLMIGSLRKIWPGHYLSGDESTLWLFYGALIALFGGFLIWLLETVSRKIEN